MAERNKKDEPLLSIMEPHKFKPLKRKAIGSTENVSLQLVNERDLKQEKHTGLFHTISEKETTGRKSLNSSKRISKYIINLLILFAMLFILIQFI